MTRMHILCAIVALAVPASAMAANGDRGTGWRIDTGGVAIGVAKQAWHVVDVGDVAAVTDGITAARPNPLRPDPSRIGGNAQPDERTRSNGALASLSARLSF